MIWLRILYLKPTNIRVKHDLISKQTWNIILFTETKISTLANGNLYGEYVWHAGLLLQLVIWFVNK